MTNDHWTLFEALPRVVRLGDVESGGPLERLVGSLEAPLGLLRDDLIEWYGDLFVETCGEARLPGFARLLDAPADATRAEIANQLERRRRPGTLSTIVGAIRDVTGLAVQGIEMIPGDVDPETGAIAVADGGARIELFVYVSDAVSVTGAEARRVGPGRFTVHPLGVDAPLFRDPSLDNSGYYTPDPMGFGDPVDVVTANVAIRCDGQPVDASEIEVVDLRDWRGSVGTDTVLLDPERGRIAVSPDAEPVVVTVDHAHGARADIGGGAYPRRDPSSRSTTPDVIIDDAVLGSLTDTIAHRRRDARVVLDHSRVHRESLDVTFDAGERFTLAAAPGRRPCLIGGAEFRGPDIGRAEVELDGLMLDGPIGVTGNVDLLVRHVTCFSGPTGYPGRAAIRVSRGARVIVSASIVGPVVAASGAGAIEVVDSVVDAGAEGRGVAIEAVDGSVVIIRSSTVMGGLLGSGIDVAASVVTGEPEIVDHLAPANRLASLTYGDPRYASPRLVDLNDLEPDLRGHSLVGAHAARGHLGRLRRVRATLDGVVPIDVGVEIFLL